MCLQFLMRISFSFGAIGEGLFKFKLTLPCSCSGRNRVHLVLEFSLVIPLENFNNTLNYIFKNKLKKA